MMYNQLIIAIELVLGGILLGGIYSLAALGFSINYSVAKIMNLSHGEFLILGGLFTYILVRIFNLNLLISIIMVSFASFIFGYLFYIFLINPIQKNIFSENRIILVTLGSALLLSGIASTILSRNFGLPFYLTPLQIGSITLSSTRLLLFLIVIILISLLEIFLSRSNFGIIIRAVAIDKTSSQLSGINIKYVSAITFGIGSAFAALGGSLLLLVTNMSSAEGLHLTVLVILLVVLGGLGKISKILVSAITIGLIQTISGYILSPSWSFTVSLAILIFLLTFRSKGIIQT
mgnify:FL=1